MQVSGALGELYREMQMRMRGEGSWVQNGVQVRRVRFISTGSNVAICGAADTVSVGSCARGYKREDAVDGGSAVGWWLK